MTDTPTTTPISTPSEPGKSAALLVYVLYVLAIPSGGVLALVGVLVAYFSRTTATGMWKVHLDDQVRVGGLAILWCIGLFVAGMLGAVLTLILIGFAILWLVGIGYLVLWIWFTVKGVLGLIAFLETRAP